MLYKITHDQSTLAPEEMKWLYLSKWNDCTFRNEMTVPFEMTYEMTVPFVKKLFVCAWFTLFSTFEFYFALFLPTMTIIPTFYEK